MLVITIYIANGHGSITRVGSPILALGRAGPRKIKTKMEKEHIEI
jgi:hypothetical protein